VTYDKAGLVPAFS